MAIIINCLIYYRDSLTSESPKYSVLLPRETQTRDQRFLKGHINQRSRGEEHTLESLAVKHADTKYTCGREEQRNAGKERHICTVNRTAVPHVNWHWQHVPMCDPGELSQLLPGEPQSLYLSLSLDVLHVAAVVTCQGKILNV